MPEDRSLDEFAASNATAGEGAESEGTEGERAESKRIEGERAESEADDVDTGGDPPLASDGTPTDTVVEPATSTAAWRSGGAACSRCGDRVARLWIGDDDLVCATCKEW